MTNLSKLNTVQNTRRLSSSCVQFCADGMKDSGFSSGRSFGSSVSTLSCKYSTVRVSDPIMGQALDTSPLPICPILVLIAVFRPWNSHHDRL